MTPVSPLAPPTWSSQDLGVSATRPAISMRPCSNASLVILSIPTVLPVSSTRPTMRETVLSVLRALFQLINDTVRLEAVPILPSVLLSTLETVPFAISAGLDITGTEERRLATPAALSTPPAQVVLLLVSVQHVQGERFPR